MDSYFYLGVVVAVAIGFYTLLVIIFLMGYKKFKLHQENKTIASSFTSLSPSSSSASSSSSSSFHSWKYQVFPSFHGEDVRKSLLSHIVREFESKGIEIFSDKNDIEKSNSIGPKLVEAIRGSNIAIVFLSRNYASSSWCLNELVEIMKCREDWGQTVMTLFYDVDPTDVKKQTGDFGKAFKKTCKGKTKEDIRKWRYALAEVAKILGYNSKNWDTEAAMIEIITNDISNKLNNSTPSSDFEGLVGMEAHMGRLETKLCLDNLNDVRMIGIWGPCGIGKTTIARCLFNKHSDRFNMSVFMEDVKGYSRPSSSDEHGLKLHLQQQFLSQIFHQKDIEVPHLGVVQGRLKDRRVLVVLDDVDRSVQLDALAKENQWFGPGSRIIITTQDNRVLKAHGLKYIYKVDFPTPEEASQIFCMSAFGQNSPKDGFEELAWDVTYLAGIHPSGIRNMGSCFRGMSKEEWREEMSKPEWEEPLRRFRTNSVHSRIRIRNSAVGIAIRNTKQQLLSRMVSTIKKKQIAKRKAGAAKFYERCRKDFDDNKNVESSGVPLTLATKQ